MVNRWPGSPVADPEALERQRLEDPSLDHLTAIDELFKDQLQAADLVLISRADRVSDDKLREVLRSCRTASVMEHQLCPSRTVQWIPLLCLD